MASSTFITKFSIGDEVVWSRDTTNKMVVASIYIDAHQIQYNCRPLNQQLAASYFFESDLQAPKETEIERPVINDYGRYLRQEEA